MNIISNKRAEVLSHIPGSRIVLWDVVLNKGGEVYDEFVRAAAAFSKNFTGEDTVKLFELLQEKYPEAFVPDLTVEAREIKPSLEIIRRVAGDVAKCVDWKQNPQHVINVQTSNYKLWYVATTAGVDIESFCESDGATPPKYLTEQILREGSINPEALIRGVRGELRVITWAELKDTRTGKYLVIEPGQNFNPDGLEFGCFSSADSEEFSV